MPDAIALLNTPQAALFWGRQTWVDEPGIVLAHDPLRVETAAQPEQVPALLAAVEAETAAGRWVAAFVAYEGGLAFDLPTHAPSDLTPLAWMAAYEPRQVLRLAPDDLPQLPPPEGLAETQVALNVTPEQYGQAMDRIHDYIAAGDTYQVNYTCHARFRLLCDPLAYFLTMVRSHPVPYAAYLNLGDRQVLSLSPELFLQRRDNVVSSRPMKGTRRRGRTLAEDAALAADLTTSLKDRAENLMILDMVRNDLGRVGMIGSVRVPRMFTPEKYRSVWQMTSTVEVDLAPPTSLPELFAATFPGASITGAPKLRTMQIIGELEPEPRGLYCGALGLFSPGGDFTCNLPIRTLIHRQGDFDLGIGAGILWDSQTGAEYEETLLKSRFAFRATPRLRLLETLLLQADGQYLWLEEHLARLAGSAEYFDFGCEVDDLRALLQDHAAQAEELPQVVRLELDELSRASLTPRAMPAPPSRPVRVLLAEARTDATSPFQYHKTTQRALYDRERQAAVAEGFFEVIFANQEGEPTEGAISNLFVRTSEGWQTPPVTTGLLPGIWREHFLRETEAEETPLTVADLGIAQAVIIGNSVRGAVEVDEVVTAAGEVLYRRHVGA
jgi:para-aminobenzoate synthetase / 4-amino-4-deoxychorismate lyase